MAQQLALTSLRHRPHLPYNRHRLCSTRPLRRRTTIREEITMNLWIWLPALLGLGLGTMGLIFAFLSGCDKV
jgi:hypothetical protein